VRDLVTKDIVVVVLRNFLADLPALLGPKRLWEKLKSVRVSATT